jgi:cytochrome c oxidase cbb3-type subunit 2
MIRSLRDEVERYGHYSLAAESKYDHPFQWGSKRTGPDLARVGGKYSDDWQRGHLNNPRSVVPGSVMPRYGFLADAKLDFKHIQEDMSVLAIEGVPYTPEMVAKADADVKAQLSPDDAPSVIDLVKRYPKAVAHLSLAGADGPTEQDALVAYLQMLGTTVDFKLFDDKANWR